MADQDAQDINQMMSQTPDVLVAPPKKSIFLWVVLGCVVLGVGLGVVVYQQSIKTLAPSPTPKSVTTVPQASPLASPIAPKISLIEAEPKTVSFPKAGEVRVYYEVGGWVPLGLSFTDPAGPHNFAIPAGNPNTQMKILDTGYKLTGPTTVSMDTFLGVDSTKLSIGWAKPVANKCGFNGFGVIDIAPNIAFATAQAKGEPIVAVQCWGDYSPNPLQLDAKDFNDYTLIWSYVPQSTTTSPSPSGSAAASAVPSTSPLSSPSPSPSRAASPSPSVKASAAASIAATLTPTPVASPRVTMPDTSGGTPVTGIFEITVGTVSVGLILLIFGLLGLLVL